MFRQQGRDDSIGPGMGSYPSKHYLHGRLTGAMVTAARSEVRSSAACPAGATAAVVAFSCAPYGIRVAGHGIIVGTRHAGRPSVRSSPREIFLAMRAYGVRQPCSRSWPREAVHPLGHPSPSDPPAAVLPSTPSLARSHRARVRFTLSPCRGRETVRRDCTPTVAR